MDFFSRRAEQLSAECRQMVKQLVEADRSRGLDAAFSRVARASGLTARRVKAHWYSEVPAGAIAAHEIDGIRVAYAEYMRDELRRAEHRVAVLRARLSRADGEAALLAPAPVASAA